MARIPWRGFRGRWPALRHDLEPPNPRPPCATCELGILTTETVTAVFGTNTKMGAQGRHHLIGKVAVVEQQQGGRARARPHEKARGGSRGMASPVHLMSISIGAPA